ncbi:hypothetical protein [Salisediminibacterium beveridgei]|uniref:Uncharacterized protein n=1 Tax=Salisediminibacterium beveridgei TaxID=632773 RepID=A0A1D7QRX0_9BACI|nr:hypothetical protein [Salisediminibacterium beveridgei]AOM81760.1 hypothetical protein BBEV_0366 [Salisediminibacterium beveridgei]
MIKKVSILVMVLFVLSMTAAAASNFLNSDIPEEVLPENHADYQLQYSIIIENQDDGDILKTQPDGDERKIGNVLVPADSTYTASDGFWAAQFSRSIFDSSANVTATAVNAMHIRVAPDDMYDPKEAQKGRDEVWKPQLISLLPDREYNKAGPGPHPGRISTDIPGGSELFGGTASAYVGSPVYYLNDDGEWIDMEDYYQINSIDSAPDRIKIDVHKPSTDQGSPTSIVFENEENGDVTLNYGSDYSKTIATVLQRVEGTGRFGGSEYADTGFVRANHGGVLDLSTSPYVGFTWDIELMGGFQIIPANHAVYSRHFLDLNYIDRPQYMVIAHTGAEKDDLLNPVYFDEDDGLSYDPHFEAVAPVFANYIKPKHVTTHDMVSPNANLNAIPENTIKGQSTRFEFSFDDGETWHEPEPAAGTFDDNLIDVTHIKVHLLY